MRSLFKTISFILALSLLVFPLTVQETFAEKSHSNAIKIKLNHKAELRLQKTISFHLMKKNSKPEKYKLKKRSVNKGASAQAITEFEVSGTIDQYHLNNYYFTTDGGTVQVQDLVGSTDPQYDYLIYNIDTQQSYESGANLPTGNYFITVLGTSDTPVNFDYKLSGISFSNTSTVLPNMAVSSPTTHEVRLPKGQMSTTFMIQNDDPNTSQVYYYGVDGSVQTVPRTVDGNPDPFSSGYLKVGVSPVQFQIVGTNNNEVWDFYYFSTV